MEKGKTIYTIESPEEKDIVFHSIGVAPIQRDWLILVNSKEYIVRDLTYNATSEILYVYLRDK